MAISHEFREYGFEGPTQAVTGRQYFLAWVYLIRELIKRPAFPAVDREETMLNNERFAAAQSRSAESLQFSPKQAAVHRTKINYSN